MLRTGCSNFFVGEVGDWSDEELKDKLESVTGGLIRLHHERVHLSPDRLIRERTEC